MRKMAAGTEASRDFTAAGAYDTDTRDIIIDIRDAPCVKMLTPDDWIVFRAGNTRSRRVWTSRIRRTGSSPSAN